MLTSKTIVWSDTRVQIETSRIDDKYHLFMRLCSQKPFIQTTGQEVLPLKRGIEKLAHIFKDVFGSDHYTEFLQDNDAEWSFELFPVENFGTSSAEEVDVYAKVQRNFYIFSHGQIGEVGLSFTKIQRLLDVLTRDMEGYVPPNRSTRSQMVISQRVNHEQAATSCARLLLHFLEQSGLRVRRRPLFFRQKQISFPPLPRKVTTRCPFCDEKIIQKESLIEGKTMRILYNNLPYVGREGEESSHLLITPKGHVEVDSPSDDELIEEQDMLVRIKTVMQGLRPHFYYLVIRQQGLKSGQLLSHRHTHAVMYQDKQMPEFLKILAGKFIGCSEPVISQPSPKFVSRYMVSHQCDSNRQGNAGR
jgi:hypothetical protein